MGITEYWSGGEIGKRDRRVMGVASYSRRKWITKVVSNFVFSGQPTTPILHYSISSNTAISGPPVLEFPSPLQKPFDRPALEQ
jgi:hypothetical protein